MLLPVTLITAAGANFGVAEEEEGFGLALGLGEVKLMTGEMADSENEAEVDEEGLWRDLAGLVAPAAFCLGVVMDEMRARG